MKKNDINNSILYSEVRERNGYLHLRVKYRDSKSQKIREKNKSTGLTATDRNKKKALKMLPEYEKEVEAIISRGEMPIFSYFLDKFIDYCQNKGLENSTINTYQGKVNQIKQSPFSDKAFDRVTAADIEGFLFEKHKKGYTHQTLVTYRTFFHSVYEYAIKCELVEKNKVDSVKLPKKTDENEDIKRFLTKEEIERVVEYLGDSPMIIPIVLLATLGLRRGEAIGLTWENVNFDDKTVL